MNHLWNGQNTTKIGHNHCANDQLDIGWLLYSHRLKFTRGTTKEVQNDTKENISADGGDTQ